MSPVPHFAHGRLRRLPSTRSACTAAACVLATIGGVLVLESTAVGPSSAHVDITGASTAGLVEATSMSERTAPAASRSSDRLSAQAIDIRGGFVGAQATLSGDAVNGAVLTVNDSAQSVRESLAPTYAAPINDARVTSGFGPRWGRMHNGMDFAADVGHPLVAVADGRVTTAGYNSGLGHHVRITLDDGTEVTYGHLSAIGVEQGSTVEAGEAIGKVGNSGSSTGAHLHFEVHNLDGDPIDPQPWLTERGLLG